MNNQKLSICLVVKNEEKYLLRCLTSVKDVADEIILVDTGSTDRTVEIAREFTDKVFTVRWRDDFSKARNHALSKSTGEWVLMLDGDEELDTQGIVALQEKINNADSEGYLIKVLNHYDTGDRVEIASDVIFRLFRNKKEYRYSGAIHEQICDNIIAVNPKAKISIAEDICIIHYGYLAEEIKAKNKAERNTRLLEKAVQKNPGNLLDRFHLGVEYFRASQIHKALGEFLFVLDKVDVQAVYAPKLMRYIAKCHYLLGNLEEALNFIGKVWQKYFPNHGDLYYLQGIIYRELGRSAEAYESLKKCLSVPTQPAYYANLYCQYKDKIYHMLGELAEYFADKEMALEYYIKALKENSRSTHSLAGIISILNPKENPEYTMIALNTVFDLTDPGLQLDLGHIFFREGAYQLAVQCFEEATRQIQAPVEVCLVKGLSLLRSKQFLPAVKELSLVPPGNDFFVTAQSNLFLYYWMKKLNQKTAACLRNIKNTGINPALAEVLEILRKGWQAAPEEIKSGEEKVFPIVSEIFERLIEWEEFDSLNDALSCFEELYENKTQLTRLLGDLYFKYKIYDKAETEYRHLLGSSIADAEIFYRLGKTCWAQRNLSEAEIYFCKTAERGYNPPQVNWEMARLYQDLAVETLEEGLNKCPGNKDLQNFLVKVKENLIEV